MSLYRNNVGTTIYHGFYTKLEQRFSRGLSYLVSYTRSKLMDDASSVFDASILTGPVANFPVADSFNRRLERDYSTGDIPHVFVASAVWDIPFGANRRSRVAGVLGALVNDWTLTGVLTLQSGIPIAVTQTTNNNAFAGFGTQRPNLIGDPDAPCRRAVGQPVVQHDRVRGGAAVHDRHELAQPGARAGLSQSRPRRDAADRAAGGQGAGSAGGGLQRHEHAAAGGAEHHGRLGGLRDDHLGRRSPRRAAGGEVRLLELPAPGRPEGLRRPDSA